MALQVQSFVFDCPSRRGSPWPALKMTAKRYRSTGVSPQRDGLTLMFFHCIGARTCSQFRAPTDIEAVDR